MPRIILVTLALILALSSGAAAADTCKAQEELQRLDWLIGTWQRIDLPEGREGREIWSPATTEPGLTGRGIATRRDGSRFEERLRIGIHDEAVHYVAEVPGNPAPVYFRLTRIDDNHVVFENPVHDFPQVIAYERDGDALLARISAGDRQIEFRFRHDP